MKNQGGTSNRAPRYSTGLEDKGVNGEIPNSRKKEIQRSARLFCCTPGTHEWYAQLEDFAN